MPKKQAWVITTSGDRPVADIAHDLVEIGLQHEQILDQIDCITGSADNDVAARLRDVPGVIDVSPDTPVDIGPPDSDTTW